MAEPVLKTRLTGEIQRGQTNSPAQQTLALDFTAAKQGKCQATLITHCIPYLLTYLLSRKIFLPVTLTLYNFGTIIF